jgi:hypothetical protein
MVSLRCTIFELHMTESGQNPNPPPVGSCQLRPGPDFAPCARDLRCASHAATLASLAVLPPKGIPAAPNNRATWTADHLPPRAAGMPRSSRPAAMARSDSRPDACSSVTWDDPHILCAFTVSLAIFYGCIVYLCNDLHKAALCLSKSWNVLSYRSAAHGSKRLAVTPIRNIPAEPRLLGRPSFATCGIRASLPLGMRQPRSEYHEGNPDV